MMKINPVYQNRFLQQARQTQAEREQHSSTSTTILSMYVWRSGAAQNVGQLCLEPNYLCQSQRVDVDFMEVTWFILICVS